MLGIGPTIKIVKQERRQDTLRGGAIVTGS
jgi:hypothetical protein